MKKTEYASPKEPTEEERLLELESEKMDDYDLPEFSKEVPVSATKTESEDRMEIEYEWKDSNSQSIKIRRIAFRKEADLADVFRIPARDGADSVSFSHRGTTYILRRTVGEISKSLFKATQMIGNVVEDIIGYLRTVLGNEYVVSRVDGECWAFDRRIARGGVKCIDTDSLDDSGRSRLIELIADRVAELHSRSLVIGRFTLNNLLFCGKDLRLSDLRRLRVSRKHAYVIEEFKSILQYLFAIGLANREDIYAAIALYTARNEAGAMEWYAEKTGKRTNDPFDIAEQMERDIYS